MSQRDEERKKFEFSIVKNAVNILALMCAANSDMIIDKLTGVLWDDEEAEGIKASTGVVVDNN